MSETGVTIIENEPTTEKNHFPIVIQLGVLSLILLGLFGTYILQSANAPTSAQLPVSQPQTEERYPIVPQKIEDVTVKATAAYVWDTESQRALYAKNAEEALPLASITKLMTSLLAYELLAEDTIANVPLSAIQQEGSSGLQAGEKFTIEELQALALISSSNDAAFALAANVGSLLGQQDPTTQFVTGMNIRADELGLETLKFWNTTGLDLSSTKPGAVGSAKDVSFLMEYIVTNYPDLLTPTTDSSTRVYNTDGLYHEASNTNPVVQQIPNLIGSKTGYTDLAGGNLTVALDVGLHRPIIITVLGSTYQERFTDVLTLVEAVQASVSTQ